MHELALAQELCEVVKKHAAGKKVKKVIVEIGQLSGVQYDSFDFCSQSVFQQLHPQVEIELQRRKGRWQCQCNNQYEGVDLMEPCPACGSFDREIIAGRDLLLTSIEIEE